MRRWPKITRTTLLISEEQNRTNKQTKNVTRKVSLTCARSLFLHQSRTSVWLTGSITFISSLLRSIIASVAESTGPFRNNRKCYFSLKKQHEIQHNTIHTTSIMCYFARNPSVCNFPVGLGLGSHHPSTFAVCSSPKMRPMSINHITSNRLADRSIWARAPREMFIWVTTVGWMPNAFWGHRCDRLALNGSLAAANTHGWSFVYVCNSMFISW